MATRAKPSTLGGQMLSRLRHPQEWRPAVSDDRHKMASSLGNKISN